MQRAHFRLIVAAHALTNIAGGLLLSRTRSQLPDPLRPYADPSVVARSPLLISAGLVMVVLAAVSILGLLAFWRPAKELFLVYAALVLLLGPTAPPVVQPALAGTVLTLSAMLAGAVIALLLFSPIGEEFGRAPAPA